jgi:hypothetical protein
MTTDSKESAHNLGLSHSFYVPESLLVSDPEQFFPGQELDIAKHDLCSTLVNDLSPETPSTNPVLLNERETDTETLLLGGAREIFDLCIAAGETRQDSLICVSNFIDSEIIEICSAVSFIFGIDKLPEDFYSSSERFLDQPTIDMHLSGYNEFLKNKAADENIDFIPVAVIPDSIIWGNVINEAVRVSFYSAQKKLKTELPKIIEEAELNRQNPEEQSQKTKQVSSEAETDQPEHRRLRGFFAKQIGRLAL